MTLKLSKDAEKVYTKVMESLKDAGDIGGILSHRDYQNLMEKIICSCHERKMNSYDAEAIEDAALEEIESR